MNLMKAFNPKFFAALILIFVVLACSLPEIASDQGATSVPLAPTDAPAAGIPTQQVGEPTVTVISSPAIELPPPTKVVPHSLVPPTSVDTGKFVINDAVSVDTAVEKRAPYGDLYKSNLFERPFLQDMTYVPDLDIVSYSLSYDEKFFYVSIVLVGSDPNNEIGINYAVELDINADGFGDFIIIGHPPYNVNWSTNNVQIVADTNLDTGGLSAERSDAPVPGDGYDTVIFDGGSGEVDDPDLAWMRVNAGSKATVQFAFKRSFAGKKFIYGVLADGGLKNIEDLDYVDRYTEEQAGSPETNEKYYPLKAVYGVDNVCREAFGFKGTEQEPQRCRPK